MSERYRCALKAGVDVARGVGTVPSSIVYLYGRGPWKNGLGGFLLPSDIMHAELCPIDSEPVTMQDGRATS